MKPRQTAYTLGNCELKRQVCASLPSPLPVRFLCCLLACSAAGTQITRAKAKGVLRCCLSSGDVERDFWLAFDLLQDPKDHAEFTIVRNWVKAALSVSAPCPSLPFLSGSCMQTTHMSCWGPLMRWTTQGQLYGVGVLVLLTDMSVFLCRACVRRCGWRGRNPS